MVFHSSSSSFLHNLKWHLHHPLFRPQGSQGKIFTHPWASPETRSTLRLPGRPEPGYCWSLGCFPVQLHSSTLLDPAHHPQPLLSPSSMARTKLCRPQPALSWIRVVVSLVGCHTHCPRWQFQLFTSSVCLFQAVHTLLLASQGTDAKMLLSKSAMLQYLKEQVWTKGQRTPSGQECRGSERMRKSRWTPTPVKGARCSSTCFFPLCFPLPKWGI